MKSKKQLFCYAKQFLTRIDTRLSERITLLEASKDDFIVQHRRPLKRTTVLTKLSTEPKLLQKVKGNRKLKNQFQKVKPPVPQDFETALQTGKQMFTEEAILGNIDINRLILSAVEIVQLCELDKLQLTPLSIDEASEYLISRSSSGFPFFVKQSDKIDYFVTKAKDYYQKLDWSIFLWPITVAFRLQLRYDQNQVVTKVRTIYMYFTELKLFEGMFFHPFYDAFKQRAPFYSTGDRGIDISKNLKRIYFHAASRKKENVLSSTDFSKYDLHLLNIVIILAFWVIRSSFKLYKNEALLFEQIVLYCCASYVTSNTKLGGFEFYVKNHGLPSGTTFTNLVGTICHAIMANYIQPGILNKCLICSDDNVFNSKGMDLSNYANELKEFNMVLTMESYTDASNVFYLGFYWKWFVRELTIPLALSQIVYHTEYRTDLDEFDRLVSRSASICFNGNNGIYVFKRLFPKLTQCALAGYDCRFIYFNYAKPRFVAEETPQNSSLKHHILYGWKIR